MFLLPKTILPSVSLLAVDAEYDKVKESFERGYLEHWVNLDPCS